MTPKIICPKCEFVQPAASQCRRCELTLAYPVSGDTALMVMRAASIAAPFIERCASLATELERWVCLASSLEARADEPVLEGTLVHIERQAILSTLRQCDGDRQKAAIRLGIGKTTIYRKLKDYGA